MICEKCKKEFPSNKLHYHHIFPKKYGGTDADGRIILCENHHTGKEGIHEFLKCFSLYTKEDFEKFTKLFLEYKEGKRLCPNCNNNPSIKRYGPSTLFIKTVKRDSVILGCSDCGYEEESVEALTDHIQNQLKEGKGDDSIQEIRGD